MAAGLPSRPAGLTEIPAPQRGRAADLLRSPLSPAQAALRAALVLAGGLWQGALVVSSWAVSRGSGERTAMAGSYESLSRYAGELG